jgi:polyisoprenoid-binding protein YceI
MWHKSLIGVVLAVWSLAQPGATGVGPTVLTIDAADSQVIILVGKTGIFGFASHAHEVVAPAVTGRVTYDLANLRGASVSLEFNAPALRVTGRGEPPEDVPEVQRVMLSGQVLDVARYPKIVFQSRRVSVTAPAADSASVLIEGDMTLHGTTRPIAIRATVSRESGGRVSARGSFTLKQTEFGIEPVTALGGTIRAKDELDIRFLLRASPTHETSPAR